MILYLKNELVRIVWKLSKVLRIIAKFEKKMLNIYKNFEKNYDANVIFLDNEFILHGNESAEWKIFYVHSEIVYCSLEKNMLGSECKIPVVCATVQYSLSLDEAGCAIFCVRVLIWTYSLSLSINQLFKY